MKTFLKYFLSLTALVTIFQTNSFAQQKDISYYLSNAPFKMPPINSPVFPDKIFSVKDYGAVPDAKTLNTSTIQNTIDQCSRAGGGRVLISQGTWLTGPIEMKSNVELHLEKNCLLQFTDDHSQYPIINLNGDGKTFAVASPLYSYKCENIAITGDGIIDGAGDSWRPVRKSKVDPNYWALLTKKGVLGDNGNIWWPSADAMNGQAYLESIKNKSSLTADDYLPARDFMRPYMIYFNKSKNILIEGVTVRNSPKFAVYPGGCENIIINGVKVFNEWWAQNGDGIDISACLNAVVYNTTVNAGDDGICLKSSAGDKTNEEAKLKNIIIADCTVRKAHGGFVIGSNTDGGIENVFVADCIFDGPDNGIRVKSGPGTGGLVKNIYISNITMKNISGAAIIFTSDYEDNPAGSTSKNKTKTNSTEKIPRFTGFHISNIDCESSETAISISGLEQMPVDSIYLNDVAIKSKTGFVSDHANNIFMTNVTLNSSKPLFKIKNSENIFLDGAELKGND